VAIENIEPALEELVRGAERAVLAVGEVIRVLKVPANVIHEEVHIVAAGEVVWRLHRGELGGRAVYALSANSWKKEIQCGG
jgi:hypothetical protein